MLSAVFAILLLLAARAIGKQECPPAPAEVQFPNATFSGYVDTDHAGSKLFYMFYEADDNFGRREHDSTPITLWLQGGPGCASLFGAFYELGPELVDADLGLLPNSGTWNRQSALLFIDQPIGAGFSVAGEGRPIPRDEMTLATDLYAGLQAFFLRYPRLQERPLVIAGESYAGKYVPSIGHFILQQAARLGGRRSRGRPLQQPGAGSSGSSSGHAALTRQRAVPAQLLASRPLLSKPPLFDLRALAIGNGLSDPVVQVMAHADTAYFMGRINPQQRLRAMTMQLETVQLISAERWEEAHSLRSALLEYLTDSAGAATLLDMRRYEDYDANKLVDCYLNLPEVQEALGVSPATRFESCSGEVGAALGPDVMRSVKDLIPDLLAAYPLLLYQGMHDAQDGAASSEAWIYSLQWEGRPQFLSSTRHIVRAKDLDSGDEPSASSSSTESAGSSSEGRQRSGRDGDTRLQLGRGARLSSPLQRQLRAAAAGGSSEQQQAAGDQQGRLEARRSGPGRAVVAYWKQGGGLTHVVLTEAGHMTPRDAPLATRWMLERWLDEALK